MDRATRTTLIESSESSLSIGDQPIERISKETKYLGIILDRDQYIHRLTRGLLQGLHLFNSSFRRVNPNDIVHISIESLSKKKKNYLPSINRSRTLPPNNDQFQHRIEQRARREEMHGDKEKKHRVENKIKFRLESVEIEFRVLACALDDDPPGLQISPPPVPLPPLVPRARTLASGAAARYTRRRRRRPRRRDAHRFEGAPPLPRTFH